jgi:hypothetical protein
MPGLTAVRLLGNTSVRVLFSLPTFFKTLILQIDELDYKVYKESLIELTVL